MTHHPLSDQEVEKFRKDYEAVFGKIMKIHEDAFQASPLLCAFSVIKVVEEQKRKILKAEKF